MFKCSFSPSANEDSFKLVKEDSGVNLIEYDREGVVLHGSKPQLLKALSLLADRDLVVIDFSNCVSDSLNTKTVRTVFRKAKKARLSALLDKADLPSCLGSMPWRFTTPRTSLDQDKGTVSALTKCISCNLSDICFSFSVLQKLEELKWYRNKGLDNDS